MFEDDEITPEDEIIQKAIFGKIPKNIIHELRQDGYLEIVSEN